jgi:hypothetical protein
MRLLFIVVSLISLVAATYWSISRPGLDSIVAALAALAAFIASLISMRSSVRASMSQEVGPGGLGIQAGGDVKARDINR